MSTLPGPEHFGEPHLNVFTLLVGLGGFQREPERLNGIVGVPKCPMRVRFHQAQNAITRLTKTRRNGFQCRCRVPDAYQMLAKKESSGTNGWIVTIGVPLRSGPAAI
jgi:hypothetical protein